MAESLPHPVAILPLKRQRDSPITWETCIFCQNTEGKISQGSQQGIEKIKEAFLLRSKFNDYANREILDRLEPHIETLESKHPKWHTKTCYSIFCSMSHIERLRRKCQTHIDLVTGEEKVAVQSSLKTNSLSRLSRSRVPQTDWNKCIFCQIRTRKPVHQVLTKNAEEKIREAAVGDHALLCRIADLDLIAYEAKYHRSCFIKASKTEKTTTVEESGKHDQALSKLFQELDSGFDEGHIYTLNVVFQRFQFHLKTQGLDIVYSKHKLQDKIISHYGSKIQLIRPHDRTKSTLIFPTVPAGTAVLALDNTAKNLEDLSIKESMLTSTFSNEEEELLRSMHYVSSRIRCDMKNYEGYKTYDSLSRDIAKETIPDSLLLFLKLLIEGKDSDDKTEDVLAENSVRNESIAQDIIYAFFRGKKLTPKHVGLAMSVHQATRSKSLVQLLNKSGHCISYEGVQRIDTAIAQHQLTRFTENDNIFMPQNLQPGRFVQFAGDNIDILEETIDGKDTFHGMQVVAFQSGPPTVSHPGIDITSNHRVLKDIPPEFNLVLQSGRQEGVHPRATFEAIPDENQLCSIFTDHGTEDFCKADLVWLISRLQGALSDEQTVPAWTAFNQMVSGVCDTPVTNIGYMPIINQPATNYDTVWTVMEQCRRISMHLGQIHTVLTFDEGLYFKARELVWLNRDTFSKFVLRLGGFHTSMNFLKVIGKRFGDAGLKDILIESEVYGEATAVAIIEGKQWNRAIRCHKMVFEALWRVYWSKFINWLDGTDGCVNFTSSVTEAAEDVAQSLSTREDDIILEAANRLTEALPSAISLLQQFDQLCSQDSNFVFWRSYLSMVQILLNFVRAERDGLWNLHLDSFSKMLPWMAAYDHVNYLRWGTVYRVDMALLPQTAPDVHREFMNGNFVVKETAKKFNSIPVDEALEHVNKLGKVAGGLIGISKTDTARDRWCITYNERAKMALETRKMFGMSGDNHSIDHKEAAPNRMAKDESDVTRLQEQIEAFGVFSDSGIDLVCVSTKDVVPSDVRSDLLNAQKVGENLVKDVLHRLMPGTESNVDIFSKIPKAKSKTFASISRHKAVMKTEKAKSVRADRDLFKRLLVAAESGRNINLTKLLQHELTSLPLSMAKEDGSMRTSLKSQLMDFLSVQLRKKELPQIDKTAKVCTIIDGMALVQSIGKASFMSTFGDFADYFASIVFAELQATKSTRVDVVFDQYRDKSIKTCTRQKRSASAHPIRRRIENRDVPLPKQWSAFLSLGENKADLANFLSHQLIEKATLNLGSKLNVITAGGFRNMCDVVSSLGDVSNALSSTHEEADTRMILHAIHASDCGFQRIIVKSRDTDVFILLLRFCEAIGADEIWMASGTKACPKFLPVHMICQQIGHELCNLLPAYHALTGCDSTSQLVGLTKRKTWPSFVNNFHLIADVGCTNKQLTTKVLENTELFFIKCYDSDSTRTSIDDLRVDMFRKKNPDSLPPSRDSLYQHIKRAHYQSLIWNTSCEANPSLPQPTEYGWLSVENGGLSPLWRTLETLPSSCPELLTCKCKNDCIGNRCGCKRKFLPCSGACGCSGECSNQYSSTVTAADTE